jgi:uncharacterized membrane protein YdjX (TVP38/TMEM64 family)
MLNEESSPLIVNNNNKEIKKETKFQSCINWLKNWTWKTWLNFIIFLFIIGGIITLSIIFNKAIFQQYLPNLLNFIKKLGILGYFIFALIYIIATICFIPGSILTLGGGFIFGLYWGSFIVWIGATIGATLAFLLGRTLVRGWVEKKIKQYPTFEAIENAVKKEGWKIVGLLRLSPILPFNLLNYALALTNVTFLHYFLSTAFGMIPGTILYTYFGSIARNISDIASGEAGPNLKIQIIIWVISGVVIIITVIFITIIARKAINKAIKEQNEKKEIENKNNHNL